MIEMRTATGQKVRVADDRADHWEAQGFTRADQPAPAAKKAPAKKAPAKRAAKKSAKKSSKK